MKYRRVMIFGRPGSGKSTFALKLHEQTALPLYHLDKYFYAAHWVERPYHEFLAIQEQLVAQERWIIDGNQTKSFEMRWHRADLILYFNLPKWICYYRAFKRLLYKNSRLQDRAPQCKERIRLSFLRYMWNFEERVRAPIAYLREKYPQTQFVEINDTFVVREILNCAVSKAFSPFSHWQS